MFFVAGFVVVCKERLVACENHYSVRSTQPQSWSAIRFGTFTVTVNGIALVVSFNYMFIISSALSDALLEQRMPQHINYILHYYGIRVILEVISIYRNHNHGEKFLRHDTFTYYVGYNYMYHKYINWPLPCVHATHLLFHDQH